MIYIEEMDYPVPSEFAVAGVDKMASYVVGAFRALQDKEPLVSSRTLKACPQSRSIPMTKALPP
jgi:hypothetical protein